jgi:hypothetical protein
MYVHFARPKVKKIQIGGEGAKVGEEHKPHQ